MAVAFVQTITAWGALGAGPQTSGAFTGTAGDILIEVLFNGAASGQARIYGGSLNTPLENQFFNDTTDGNTLGIASINGIVGGSQTLFVNGSAVSGFAQEYGGVGTATFSSPVNRLATANPIGSAVTVPVGSILLSWIGSTSAATVPTAAANGGVTPAVRGSGTNTTGYAWSEYVGTGGSITPSWTATAADWVIFQVLLSPPSAANSSAPPNLKAQINRFRRGPLTRFSVPSLPYGPSNTTLSASGTSVFTTVGVGALTASGILSGVCVATTNAAGSLLGTGSLFGVSVATSVAAGNLIGLGALAGISAATTNATGNLQANGFLFGVSVATTAASANLLGSGVLAGVSSTTSVGIGDLEPFSGGAISGVSVVSTYGVGTLLGLGALSGVSVATTKDVGNLIGVGGLSGISIFTTNATGNLSAAGILAGVAASTSILIANLQGSGVLSGVALSTTLAIGDLQPFSAGATAGISIATTYAVGEMSFIFTPPAGPDPLPIPPHRWKPIPAAKIEQINVGTPARRVPDRYAKKAPHDTEALDGLEEIGPQPETVPVPENAAPAAHAIEPERMLAPFKDEGEEDDEEAILWLLH